MKKIIAMILVLVMLFSFASSAFAVANDDYVPGQIIVALKNDVTVEDGDYISLFPELEVESVEVFERFNDFAREMVTELVLTLKEKTKEATNDALYALRENKYARTWRPNYNDYYAGEIIVGDVNRDGICSNGDLIRLARYIVGLTELKTTEIDGADVNADGIITNNDLVAIAKMLVNRDVPETEEDIERTILTALWNNSPSKRSFGDNVLAFLGTYSGCEVAYMGSAVYYKYTTTMTIGEYTFEVFRSADFLVHKGNEFKTVADAYGAGWITDDDLAAIYEANAALIAEYKEEEKDNSTSIEMDEELETRLSIDYVVYASAKDSGYVLKIDFYGTYSGCYVAFVIHGGIGTAALEEAHAAGYTFIYPSSLEDIYVINDGDTLLLELAYNEGWIEDEDVAAIWEIYMNR